VFVADIPFAVVTEETRTPEVGKVTEVFAVTVTVVV
jgi:hypothetical protein